jgi:hypothetical protein
MERGSELALSSLEGHNARWLASAVSFWQDV